jgi:hypothetical protein
MHSLGEDENGASGHAYGIRKGVGRLQAFSDAIFRTRERIWKPGTEDGEKQFSSWLPASRFIRRQFVAAVGASLRLFAQLNDFEPDQVLPAIPSAVARD